MATHPYREGNTESELVSLRELVSDPQFKAGYVDRLAGRPPPRFYYAERIGEDSWGYERGRAVASWLLATGQKLPKANAVTALIRAYKAACIADAVL